MSLPPIPLDDVALDLIDHALNAVYDVDDDGIHHNVGSDMTLDQLLDFWSGPSPREHIRDTAEYIPIMWRSPRYSEHDLIRALVAEIRRLR